MAVSQTETQIKEPVAEKPQPQQQVDVVCDNDITSDDITSDDAVMSIINKYKSYDWFDIYENLDDMDECYIKSYLEMVQTYGWKFFSFRPKPKIQMTRHYTLACAQCQRKTSNFMRLSSDGGRCQIPRFKPHDVRICIKCVKHNRNFPTPPSCCWNGQLMVKSANKC